MGVGGPNLLGAQVGDVHLVVAFVGGDRRGEAGLLLVGEPLGAAQHVPDPVERVAGAATMTVDLLLDAAADLIDRAPGQRHDMEGIQHGGGIGVCH